ncbi:MAG: hypothetical protein OGM09_13900 [Fusobacterium varium]|uniref:hypothetical protein n=1 Tax=Fusobacterium varium TaxID=856 RepID=UPI0024317E34|nr:hypothetical protein [Fusobacterium varium]UYI78237.1 MAG: hypothetical protein OGM09_13900 [Fusobacterium varium]
MRGIMGLGNMYVIGKATQRLSNYLINPNGDIGKTKDIVIVYVILIHMNLL